MDNPVFDSVEALQPELTSMANTKQNGCEGEILLDCADKFPDKAGGSVDLLKSGSLVLKPFQTQGRGETENEFYCEVENLSTKNGSELHKDLKSFLSIYRGTALVRSASDNYERFIALEDLTHGLHKPSVMDIKMGVQSYAPDAPQAKKDYESRKFPHREEIGFFIPGYRVYVKETQSYTVFNKTQGKAVTPETVPECIRPFFVQSSKLNKLLIKQALDQIVAIEKWFLNQTLYRFFASSLLFVYEGDTKDGAEPRLVVKMIDFGHVKRDGIRDHGYLKGLRNLRRILETFLQE